MKRILTCISLLLFCMASGAQTVKLQCDGTEVVTTTEDIKEAARIIRLAAKIEKNRNEKVNYAGRLLVGAKYEAGTLSQSVKGEEFRLFLDKTDCILFVEACLALASTTAALTAGDTDLFLQFARNIKQLRYRTQTPQHYSDRIHYTTEWIGNAQKKGYVKDITLQAGGQINNRQIYYMSENYTKYPALKNDKTELKKIKQIEQQLNKIPRTYIPKNKIDQSKIQNGDIICFCSSIPGLDISHVAIAHKHDGITGFIHASSDAGKVIIDPRSITQYISNKKNIIGIKIIRIQ